MPFNLFEPIAELAKSIIDRVVPDPTAKLNAQMKLAELAQSGELAKLAADTDLAKAQLRIDEIEAGSDSRFKSWWRPALGWVCVMSFALNFLAFPIISTVVTLSGHAVVLPTLDVATFMPVLLGMLGLAGYRTFEKTRNGKES